LAIVAVARSDPPGRHDANALDRLTSEDFIWIREYGRVTDKKALLEGLRAGRLAKYDLDGEQHIRLFGTTAVVTGARLLHQRAGDRKIMVTKVWVNKEGRWQRVSSQTAYSSVAIVELCRRLTFKS
jgi:hypothetical protein